jgi:hypothetical protein
VRQNRFATRARTVEDPITRVVYGGLPFKATVWHSFRLCEKSLFQTLHLPPFSSHLAVLPFGIVVEPAPAILGVWLLIFQFLRLFKTLTLAVSSYVVVLKTLRIFQQLKRFKLGYKLTDLKIFLSEFIRVGFIHPRGDDQIILQYIKGCIGQITGGN